MAAAKLGTNPQTSQLASFGSDIEAPQPSDGSRSQQDAFGTNDSSELDRAAAASAAATTDVAQIEALTRENKLLQVCPCCLPTPLHMATLLPLLPHLPHSSLHRQGCEARHPIPHSSLPSHACHEQEVRALAGHGNRSGC